MVQEHTPASVASECDDSQREFLLVLRQALLIVVCYIEKRYGLTRRIG